MRKNKFATAVIVPQWIAGVDEAGRGPWAGPVFAGAVILDPTRPIKGLKDSKLLSAKKREILAEIIMEQALSFAVASADLHEIEQLNILQASLLAMRRAVEALSIKPDLALIDGIHRPTLLCETKAIVGGDKWIESISAASILAKVNRDRLMIELDAKYPEYGFAQHKGYGTPQHAAALKKRGPCPIHRKTFKPVKLALSKSINHFK